MWFLVIGFIVWMIFVKVKKNRVSEVLCVFYIIGVLFILDISIGFVDR